MSGREGVTIDRGETRWRRLVGGLAAVLFGLSMASSPASAGAWDWATGHSIYDEEAGRDWRVDVAPYLWISNLNGTVGLPKVGTLPVGATFSQLATNLDSAFAGLLDARYRRWHVLVDGSWVELKASAVPQVNVIDAADVTASVAFGTGAVSYELPLDWKTSIELYLGGRWWRVASDILILGAGGGLFGGGLTQVWGDAIVGTRIRHAITEKWMVTFLADIGAGDADLDWQVYGSVGYKFNRYFGLSAGYRILGVDYSKGSPLGKFVYDMRQSGLLLGINLGF